MPELGNTGIPLIPPNPLQDLASISLQKVREALNKQRVVPAPTDEQLANKQAPLIKGKGAVVINEIGEIPKEFENSVDGKVYSSPSDRIDRDLSIIDTVSGRILKLTFVPRKLSVIPESHFKAIASMGRNNPFYHFTGAEDSLKFEIDWFSEKDNRQDVILNCRWVESLSKNDAYNNPPPPVILHWNSELFSDSLWLVVDAPYDLSEFQAHRQMLPQQAYQQVTLKRINQRNLTRSQIQSITI